MRKKQNLSILLWHKASVKRRRDGKAPIYLRILIDGRDQEISTGSYILREHWEVETKTCNIEAPDAHDINRALKEAVEELQIHFRILKQKHQTVTTQMLKNVYFGLPEMAIDHKVQHHTLLHVANLQVSNFGSQVEENLRSNETLKQWRATCNKIKEYAFYAYKSNDILLSEIDGEFADELLSYLTVKRRAFLAETANRDKIFQLDKTVGKGKLYFRKSVIGNLGESAAKKQVKKIKQILKLAVKKKFLVHNPIADYRCIGGDKEVAPLELYEVRRIYNKQFDIVRLEEVKDAFIFQCFTGFSFQDIFNLSPAHILKVGKNAEPWLVKERGKTKVSEMVPILPVINQLITKYKDHPYCVANNRLMPINSNAKYNGYLKEIAKLCGIRRTLKTHLARHTFADIMLNVCHMPIEDVSKMLGHRSLKTTMQYCRVKKERISNNMKAASTLLFDDVGQFKVLDSHF